MSKKLYVINSPSYVELHPSHTQGKSLISDPLSEHFTYCYYNLMKFGLVDEVVIFPRKGKHDLYKEELQHSLFFEDNKKITLNWDRDHAFDIVNEDQSSFSFFYSGYEDAKKLTNSFVLFNPVTLTINKNNCLDKSYHHFALIEGKRHEDQFGVVPHSIPRSFCPLTSNQFTNLDVNNLQSVKKEYDWIIVSALDPRKRHLEFLDAIATNPRFKTLRGCICARSPDNRDYVHDAHGVLQYLQNFIKKYNNIDLYFNANNEEKIDLLSKSKVYVCVSKFDSGPRAFVEALQAGVPALTMPHIGSADWIDPGLNGEFVSSISETTSKLFLMIDNYELYLPHALTVSQRIKPDKVYSQIIPQIKSVYEKNSNK